MSFRFPLAAVLRYREELESREERVLEQHREQLALLQAELARLKQNRTQLVDERSELLRLGLLGNDLHHLEFQQQLLDASEEDLRQKIAAAQAAYNQQMSIFLTARQKREILVELRDSRKAAYLEQLNRREQQKIDEMFSARRSREK